MWFPSKNRSALWLGNWNLYWSSVTVTDDRLDSFRQLVNGRGMETPRGTEQGYAGVGVGV